MNQTSSVYNRETIDDYNQNSVEYGERFLRIDTIKRCQKFTALLPEKAHILDAGCGSGRDTKYFLENGYHVTAFDGAEEFVRQAQAYTNHPILHLTFNEITFKEEFDGIWAMASLLHLNRQDCLQVLKQNLLPALKPGGVLYCCFLEGEGERHTRGRYFMDYTTDTLYSLFAQFETLTVLEVWEQEAQSLSLARRNWVNALVRKD